MTFSLRMLAFVIVLTGAACHRREPAMATAPTAPTGCSAALAPGSPRDERDQEIARAQGEARGGPQARQALERLGYLYVSRARVRNDSADYTLAEAAADCLESRFPGEPATLLLRGHVLHQLHRFQEAERIARVLIGRRNVVFDHGLLGDALMEQGRVAEAAAAYQTMLDMKPFYQSYARAAHLRWLKGDLDGAITALRMAIDAASPRDPEANAWAWTRMSEYELQAGRPAGALAAAETALRVQPDYADALLAKGRTLHVMHRATDAIEVLRRAARLNPVPEAQWLLADALRLQGMAEDAAALEQQLIATGGDLDPRTLALYLATRRVELRRALALVEDELAERRDIFTLDAHAWTLAANGRLDEAGAAMKRALAEGTQDGRLFLHAGAIDAAAGRPADARVWLAKADGLRSMLLPSESAELDKHLSATH